MVPFPQFAAHSGATTSPAFSPQRTLSMTTTNGTIKRITDKGFGFIATAEGTEYFFHQSACTATRFDDLREGQAVSFTVGQGPKGPRAENVNVR
jgi:cold shock protein